MVTHVLHFQTVISSYYKSGVMAWTYWVKRTYSWFNHLTPLSFPLWKGLYVEQESRWPSVTVCLYLLFVFTSHQPGLPCQSHRKPEIIYCVRWPVKYFSCRCLESAGLRAHSLLSQWALQTKTERWTENYYHTKEMALRLMKLVTNIPTLNLDTIKRNKR